MLRTFILLTATIILLSGCMASVKQVGYGNAPPVPETAHPAPFRLSNILFRLPLGHEIGNYGSQTMNLCISTYEAERTMLTSNVDTASARKAFYQTMGGLGYDVTGSDDFLFEEEEDDVYEDDEYDD